MPETLVGGAMPAHPTNRGNEGSVGGQREHEQKITGARFFPISSCHGRPAEEDPDGNTFDEEEEEPFPVPAEAEAEVERGGVEEEGPGRASPSEGRGMVEPGVW